MSDLKQFERCSSTGVKSYCTPVNWSKYFDHQQEISVKGNVFNIYCSGKTGPVLLLIHGGGYSSLTWSLFSEDITKKIDCRILAIDLRGHGTTKTDNEDNLSLDILVEDVVNVVGALFEDTVPPIMLIGHSLGGAVAVTVASLIPSVIGLCVIDVVERTALQALPSMKNYLQSRPAGFKSIEEAICWCFRGGQTRNLEAARVSMPGQIKNLFTNQLAAKECIEVDTSECGQQGDKEKCGESIYQRSCESIAEEDVNAMDNSEECEIKETEFASHGKQAAFNIPKRLPSRRTSFVKNNAYVWRTDLSKTESFWKGWFKDLSQKFLDVQVPKILLLTNIHGLDTTLTVGQMQGKFQLQVLKRSGHAIHEDRPEYVADVIAGFLVKQKLAIPKNGFVPTVPAC